eukprot:11203150-Lingulodinium_polyedra.AAC.1
MIQQMRGPSCNLYGPAWAKYLARTRGCAPLICARRARPKSMLYGFQGFYGQSTRKPMATIQHLYGSRELYGRTLVYSPRPTLDGRSARIRARLTSVGARPEANVLKARAELTRGAPELSGFRARCTVWIQGLQGGTRISECGGASGDVRGRFVVCVSDYQA